MNTDLLIVIAIAVSSIVQICVTWYLNRVNYKDEYFKKIVDKRIQTYELLENIISQIRVWLPLGDTNYNSVFHTWGSFDIFYSNLLVVLKKEIWFNKPMIKELRTLNAVLYTINEQMKQQDSKQVGVLYFETFRRTSMRLENIFYDDFKKLHKINQFIRAKKYNPETS